MVGKSSHYVLVLAAVFLALTLLLSFVSPANAQGMQEQQSFTLEEATTIEIDNVGDAHITDKITYDSDWFDQYGYIFEENPNLLSRRYRSDTSVATYDNFNVDVDSRRSTITVTFDTPGFAYNKGDTWYIYGYGSYDASNQSPSEISLEASWTLNNEFTIFEDMPLEEKVTVDLPDGTKGASFNKGTGAIQYDLPYVAKGKGILADHKTVFIIVFAMIMALSLLLFLFAITRKTAVPAAAAIAAPPIPGPPAGAPPLAPAISVTQPSGVPPSPPVEQPAEVPDEASASPKFCKRCGEPRTGPDSKFCKNCGAPFE